MARAAIYLLLGVLTTYLVAVGSWLAFGGIQIFNREFQRDDEIRGGIAYSPAFTRCSLSNSRFHSSTFDPLAMKRRAFPTAQIPFWASTELRLALTDGVTLQHSPIPINNTAPVEPDVTISREVDVYATGLPLRALKAQVWTLDDPSFRYRNAGPVERLGWSPALPVLDDEVPMMPIWRGLFVNSLVFAATWWGLVSGTRATHRGLRRRFRDRRGLCPQCAYDLADTPTCPECGFGASLESRSSQGDSP